jgi:signal peptide peptidase SppA
VIALPRLASRLFGSPLAIEPGKLDIIVAAVVPRLLNGKASFFFDDDEDDDAPPPQRQSYDVTPDGIATLDISGTLVTKTGGMNAISGLTSYEQIYSDFFAALNDPRVKGIVWNIESPGGEARGMQDLADSLYSARGRKPVVAFAGPAYSAAYLLASTANQIVIPRDAGAGSIGVLMLHLDESGADQQAGLKYTSIFAGARKNDGNPHEPLSDEARTRMQGFVDQQYALFVSAVARDRNMSPEAIRGTQALTYIGGDAINVGLADQLGTLDDAYGMVREAIQPKSIAASAAQGVYMQSPLTINTAEPAVPNQPVAAAQPPNPATAATIQATEISATEALARMQQTVDLCAIAGRPELAAGFISRGASVAEVRNHLLAGRAADSGARLNTAVMPGVDAGTHPSQADSGKAKPWTEVLADLGILKRR